MRTDNNRPLAEWFGVFDDSGQVEMNGVVILVVGLVLLLVAKQILDRDWTGLLLTLVALALIVFTGRRA